MFFAFPSLVVLLAALLLSCVQGAPAAVSSSRMPSLLLLTPAELSQRDYQPVYLVEEYLLQRGFLRMATNFLRIPILHTSIHMGEPDTSSYREFHFFVNNEFMHSSSGSHQLRKKTLLCYTPLTVDEVERISEQFTHFVGPYHPWKRNCNVASAWLARQACRDGWNADRSAPAPLFVEPPQLNRVARIANTVTFDSLERLNLNYERILDMLRWFRPKARRKMTRQGRS